MDAEDARLSFDRTSATATVICKTAYTKSLISLRQQEQSLVSCTEDSTGFYNIRVHWV